jgi:UDP:flavonoid glycosyltransferase YjiC (YdhE family)
MSRILVYTSPERGHLYPLVSTLLEFIQRGHEVRVLTMSGAVEELCEMGIETAPVDSRIESVKIDDWRARTPIGAQRREVAFFVDRAPHEFADVTAALEDADAVLVDATSWGAQAAAEASDLPWAMFAHFPLPIPSRDAPPYGLGLAPRADFLGRTRAALARRARAGRPVKAERAQG